MRIKVKGTPEQALAAARDWNVEATVVGEKIDEQTGAVETTLRIFRKSVEAARRWAQKADDTFPVGTVVDGYE